MIYRSNGVCLCNLFFLFVPITVEVGFLAWGVRLCIMVRKAPSEFNESKYISIAIYNEFLITCFLNVSMYVFRTLKQTHAHHNAQALPYQISVPSQYITHMRMHALTHRLFLQSPANPDLLYIIFFCHTQLTVTILLALIFGSRVSDERTECAFAFVSLAHSPLAV